MKKPTKPAANTSAPTELKSTPEKAKNEVDFEPVVDESPLSVNPNQKEEIDYVIEWALDGDYSDIEELSPILDEMCEAYSVSQRMHKRQVMRRYKNKIKVARVRAERRRANTSTLRKRAKVSVVKKYKARFFGGSYQQYQKASASQKNNIERLIKRRKAVIMRSTNRMINAKRQQDRRRLQRNSTEFTGNELIETFNNLYNSLIKE